MQVISVKSLDELPCWINKHRILHCEINSYIPDKKDLLYILEVLYCMFDDIQYIIHNTTLKVTTVNVHNAHKLNSLPLYILPDTNINYLCEIAYLCTTNQLPLKLVILTEKIIDIDI